MGPRNAFRFGAAKTLSGTEAVAKGDELVSAAFQNRPQLLDSDSAMRGLQCLSAMRGRTLQCVTFLEPFD